MMDHSSNSDVTEFQQLWGSWNTLLDRVHDDPRVSQLMNTRIGQYLSSHPVLALAVMLFVAMAAVPVGLFLAFALVTITVSAVGFVFFDAVLLFVGGVSLLCVLSGIAFFSVMVSFIFNVFYIIASNILKSYYPHLTKRGKVQEMQSETSKPQKEEE
ncbi:lipid droplet assembly factor 1-like [Acanthopagrus latus]|uniref:lipid droplet assembly factor 1-like n=1 Tax=Acanthopagrus latus TaxID=8177 RepID=UPI00187C3358|nr:lipid droplet assembly factor 1-like [Acanthopagrus latus]